MASDTITLNKGSITYSESEDFKFQLQEAMEKKPEKVILDFEEQAKVGSVAINLIVQYFNMMRARNIEMEIIIRGKSLFQILSIANINKIIPIRQIYSD